VNLKKALLLSVAALFITGSAYAMGPGGPSGGPPFGPLHMERLQFDLDLSDTQAASLKQLFEEQRIKHRQHRKQRRTMRNEMHNTLSELLTVSQLEDFKAIQQQQRRKGHRKFEQRQRPRCDQSW
jgi:Spy/CpxP family protein refolding chaperone